MAVQFRALMAYAILAAVPSAGQGSIAGSVVDVLSGDMVKKAVVTVTWQGTPRAWATTRTDGSGQFKITGLPAGKYDLRAVKQGVGTAVYGANHAQELGDFVTLGEGEARTGLKLRMLHSGSIAGRVLDSDGDPVIGASVSLLRPGRNLGERVLLNYRTAATDDRGEYRLPNIDPGEYYVRSMPGPQRGMQMITPFGASGARPPDEIQVSQYFPGTRNAKDASPVRIRGGEIVTGIDFRMMTERAAAIHGRVTGMPALPPPPETTQAPQTPQAPRIGLGGPMRKSQGPAVEIRIVSDEDSLVQQSMMGTIAQPPDYRFALEHIVAGPYRLEATFRDGPKTYAALQTIDARDGGGEVALALVPATDLRGQLTMEGPGAQPASLFQITLSRARAPQDRFSAQVGADGKFTFPQIAPGEWELNMVPSPRGIFLKAVHLGDKDVRFQRIPIESGSEAQLHIVLSSNTAKMEGEVDAAGGDSKRAGIVIAPVGKLHELARFYFGVTADDEGKFKMIDIAPGKYKIFAVEKMQPISFRTPEAADVLDPLGEEVEFTEGATIKVHPKLIPLERANQVLNP